MGGILFKPVRLAWVSVYCPSSLAIMKGRGTVKIICSHWYGSLKPCCPNELLILSCLSKIQYSKNLWYNHLIDLFFPSSLYSVSKRHISNLESMEPQNTLPPQPVYVNNWKTETKVGYTQCSWEETKADVKNHWSSSLLPLSLAGWFSFDFSWKWQ